MAKKIQPSVLKFNFEERITSSSDKKYLDLSQVASIMNRRFYRQGLQWSVAGIKIQQTESTAFGPATGYPLITISKLPSTWMMSNGWEKCFRSWKKQQSEALDSGDQQSVKARFNDFKIYMDANHANAGVASNLLPVDASSNLAAPGEWDMSQIVIPNFTAVGNNIEPYIYGVGAYDLTVDATKVGLIEAYANSRSVPQSPDPAVPAGVASATGNIFTAMFDVGDNSDDVMDNAIGKNDDLPYPQTNYPGGDNQLPGLEIHDRNMITNTTVSNTSFFDGGVFPCGLIEFNFANFSATTENPITLYIEVALVPGHSRGYLTESMTEM